MGLNYFMLLCTLIWWYSILVTVVVPKEGLIVRARWWLMLLLLLLLLRENYLNIAVVYESQLVGVLRHLLNIEIPLRNTLIRVEDTKSWTTCQDQCCVPFVLVISLQKRCLTSHPSPSGVSEGLREGEKSHESNFEKKIVIFPSTAQQIWLTISGIFAFFSFRKNVSFFFFFMDVLRLFEKFLLSQTWGNYEKKKSFLPFKGMQGCSQCHREYVRQSTMLLLLLT